MTATKAMTPMGRVRFAIMNCGRMDIAVLPLDDHGVEWDESNRSWFLRSPARSVSIVGAILLTEQLAPRVSWASDPDATVALALDIDYMSALSGLLDGYGAEPAADMVRINPLLKDTRQRYLQWLEHGYRIRFENRKTCDECGQIFWKSDRTCPMCEERGTQNESRQPSTTREPRR